MIWIAFFLLGFLGLRLLIAFLNFIFPTRLSNKKIMDNESSLVSVLIPARNEAKNLPNILDDLMKQHYRNIEILVYDDDSADNTPDILDEYSGRDSRISFIKGNTLPSDWLGKNRACHQLSKKAKGSFLLFLDADVRVQPLLISQSLKYLIDHRLELLTIFPKQILITKGEKYVVPLMNWILVSLLPLFLVRRSKFVSLSAANGQFMLFNATTYHKHKFHKMVKKNPVEDIAISRIMKRMRYKIQVLLGNRSITCRMYTSYNEAVNGFSKNITHFFGDSFLLALVFSLITTFSLPLVYFALPLQYTILYILSGLLLRFFVSLSSKQSVLFNFLYIFIQQFSMLYVILKSIQYQNGMKLEWKGRIING